MFRWKPSPRHVAFPTLALGVFGVVAYSTSLIQGSPSIPAITSLYFIFASLLMVVGGASIWRPSPRGWWFSWAGMVAVSASGIFPFDTQGSAAEQMPQISRLFQAGFMVIAAGIFFAALSHPDVYRPCFEPGPLPKPLVVGAPLLLVVLGAGIAAFDPMGIFVGPFALFAMLISGNLFWMAKPVLAAFRHTSEWNAG